MAGFSTIAAALDLMVLSLYTLGQQRPLLAVVTWERREGDSRLDY